MSVVKLDGSHKAAIRGLFQSKKHMGVSVDDPSFTSNGTRNFNQVLYNIFCANYLGELQDFHAYGYMENYEIVALISFYESNEEPAWYYTLYRSGGDNNKLRDVLDAVIAHNEAKGRLKFYTLVNQDHSRLLRRFHWSKYNNERYGYFDEYVVPGKNRCFYTNAWELLFKRFLVPENTVVRCNFLKNEHRTELPIGGNI